MATATKDKAKKVSNLAKGLNLAHAISLDTETTGSDLYHGAAPFLVTFADENLDNTFYEWGVDPLTRKVKTCQQDVNEIVGSIEDAECLVLQNPKFDVTALLPIFPEGYVWPWHKTFDTLIAGHLLASNHAHDLTSMAVEYLAVDIAKYEDKLEAIVKACRNIVSRKDSPFKDWRIAKTGMPEMPSAKNKTWKYDLWLPRTAAKRKVPEWKKDWLTATSEYANVDSVTTLAMFRVMVRLLKDRGLWEIYLFRLKMLRAFHETERAGVTVSRVRHKELTEKYREEVAVNARVCVNIAESKGYELKLPKGANNNSLLHFCFGKPNDGDNPLFPDRDKTNSLDLPIVEWTETGNPSLNKFAMEEYAATLPPKSLQMRFIKALRTKRKRDTSLGFLEAYSERKFGLPFQQEYLLVPDWTVLHPSLNSTGTDTLRCTSENPNEQQISKQKDEEGQSIRYIFGPAPGREWWSIDCQNVELRIPGYESGEQEIIDLFESSDEPPYYGSVHLLNFSTVYPELWEPALKKQGIKYVGPWCKKKYNDTWYQWCKNGDFAVQYGAIDRDDGEGTADRAFHKPGAHKLLKERFGNLEQLNQQYINYAGRYGYVETLPDKTVNPKRGYPLLCSRSQWGGIKPTVPLNYHVQGTAMWVMLRAMVLVQEYLDKINEAEAKRRKISIGELHIRRLGYYLIMQIHDEIVLDFPKVANKGNLAKAQHIRKLVGSIGYDLVPSMPLPAGLEYHPICWSEGESVAA